MPSDIVREFDPNIYLPEEIKNAVLEDIDTDSDGIPDGDPDYDEQFDTLDDDSSDIDEDSAYDEPDVPSDITIVSQTVHTDPSGRQVVDVVIEFEDIDEAVKYDVRITKS